MAVEVASRAELRGSVGDASVSESTGSSAAGAASVGAELPVTGARMIGVSRILAGTSVATTRLASGRPLASGAVGGEGATTRRMTVASVVTAGSAVMWATLAGASGVRRAAMGVWAAGGGGVFFPGLR